MTQSDRLGPRAEVVRGTLEMLVVTGGVAVLASLAPALRAARIDPNEALRAD